MVEPAPRGGLFGTGILDFNPDWEMLKAFFQPPKMFGAADAAAAKGMGSAFVLPGLNIFNEREPGDENSNTFAERPDKGQSAETQKAVKDKTDVAPTVDEPSSEMGRGGIMGTLGNILAPPSLTGQGGPGGGGVNIPSGFVSNDTALKTAMIQAGLSLMTPSWGNTLSQVGQAAGQGAEAFTRTKQSGRQDVSDALEVEKTKADIRGADALANARTVTAESTKEKRLKGKTDRSTELERLASGIGLGPKGTTYLKTRMKSFDDITDPDAELPPAERFNKLVEDARAMDAVPDAVKKAPNVGGTDTVQATDVTGGLKPGDIRKGHKFKGGDPADKANWEKVK
jgi:hypothetical protein